jgi:hypothetical protein
MPFLSDQRRATAAVRLIASVRQSDIGGGNCCIAAVPGSPGVSDINAKEQWLIPCLTCRGKRTNFRSYRGENFEKD